jgi:hypothetical protein
MNFRQSSTGANHVNALSEVNVTALVEDKSAEKLVKKAYRYMAALHACLEQTQLVSADTGVKIVVRVDRVENSPLYSNTDKEDDSKAVFRKEIVLYCEVDHYENY